MALSSVPSQFIEKMWWRILRCLLAASTLQAKNWPDGCFMATVFLQIKIPQQAQFSPDVLLPPIRLPCASVCMARVARASYAATFLGKKSSLQLQYQIIHSPPLHLGEATGSWWSGSAKHPNWRRQCAAGGNQLVQMPPPPPPPCHVFWAGQRRVGRGAIKRVPRNSDLMPTQRILARDSISEPC